LLTPILPINILNEIVSKYETEGDKNENIAQSLFYTLPKDNSMTFVYLLSFFREMLSCADKNKLTPEKISEILCECLVGEDKLTKTNSKNFRRDNIVRADTALGKRRLTSPGKSRPSNPRKNALSRLSQQAAPEESPLAGEDAEDEIGEEEVQNLSVEQLKSKLRY